MDKHPFSTRRGRKVRAQKLRANPLCERCEAGGLVVIATEVHHKIKVDERPDLGLDWDNLESLCEPCHEKAEGGDPLGNVGGCGVDGMPTHANHPWSKERAKSKGRGA